MPAGTAVCAGKTLADLRPDNLLPVVVRPGETLLRIARARKVSVGRLRLVNAVNDDGEVTAGTTILVPRAAPGKGSKDAPPTVARPKFASGAGRAAKPAQPR